MIVVDGCVKSDLSRCSLQWVQAGILPTHHSQTKSMGFK